MRNWFILIAYNLLITILWLWMFEFLDFEWARKMCARKLNSSMKPWNILQKILFVSKKSMALTWNIFSNKRHMVGMVLNFSENPFQAFDLYQEKILTREKTYDNGGKFNQKVLPKMLPLPEIILVRASRKFFVMFWELFWKYTVLWFGFMLQSHNKAIKSRRLFQK